MRIGIDLTAIWRPTTGMEMVAIEMTRALLQRDQKNQYVLFFSGEIHPGFEEFRDSYEPVVAPRVHEALLKNFWFPRQASAAKLDYLHFPVFPPPFWAPFARGWTVPDANPWMYPETMKIASRWYFRILGGRAAKDGCLLITDTEAARQDLVRHLGICPERVHVVYPGVKPVFRPNRDLARFERLRKRYGIPEDFILFVGTLEPRKNLPRLLRAFHLLKTERAFEPSLVIVGRKGWLCDPIFSELKDKNLDRSVVLTGYVPTEDLVVLYSRARLLAFPSLYEGFGLPSVEAMACGCPVVTSKRGALSEIGGDSVSYVNPEDEKSIADTIWEVSVNRLLRKKMIASGFKRAATFSWERHAQELLSILECAPFNNNSN